MPRGSGSGRRTRSAIQPTRSRVHAMQRPHRPVRVPPFATPAHRSAQLSAGTDPVAATLPRVASLHRLPLPSAVSMCAPSRGRNPRGSRPPSPGQLAGDQPWNAMARIVMKFGGTSVADLDRIRNVAARVKREVEAGNEVAVVVSAMAGATNQLVAWCQGALAAARRPRIRRRGRDRRAGDHRPAGDRAAGHRRRGALLAGLADPDPHRRRARQGAHRWRSRARELVRRMQAGQVPVVAGLPGARPGQPHHHAGPRRLRHLGRRARGGAEGRPLRHLHGRGRRLHDRPAHRAAGAQAGRGSRTRRCWNSPRSAPRCCRPAASSWR